MKVYKLIFIVLFSMILAVPYLDMELDLFPDIQLTENRATVSKPSLKIEKLYLYLNEYNSYFNDNFGFRNFLVNANLQIKFWILHKSPVPNKVIVGKNGFLFISPDKDLIISDKVDYLSEREYKKLEDALLKTTRAFKQHGIDYYIMPVPEKSYVYAEFLPVGYDPARVRKRFDKLIDKLSQSKELNIIALNTPLLKAKKDTIYLKYDTHWNAEGAMVAYITMLERLSEKYPELRIRKKNEYEKNANITFNGDLARQINVADKLGNKEITIVCKGPGAAKDSTIYNDQAVRSYSFTNTANEDKPDLLFLHDSFGVPLRPWIKNDFRTVHSLWISDYQFDVNSLAGAGPKIVVHEMVPRNCPLEKILEGPSH